MRPLFTSSVLVLLISVASPIAAQPPAKDTLTYELVSAEVSSAAGREGMVNVEFGRSLPARYANAPNRSLSPAPEWSIETRDRKDPSSRRTIGVLRVIVGASPSQDRLVTLEPAAPLDPAKEEIQIRMLQANFPEVIVDQPVKQGATAFYGPAKGKDDADLYFKGLVVAGNDSNPSYSVDAKAGYFFAVGSKGGSVGAETTYVVDKASDLGPDSITVGVAYSKVFAFAAATGIIVDANVFDFEFDADNETRNVVSKGSGQFVFPSAHLHGASYAAADVVAGFEAGQNQAVGGPTDSLGGLWRTVLGANGYLLLKGVPGFTRIDVTAAWKVRLLGQDEPFTKRVNDVQVTELTDSARHIVTVTSAMMVNKALGFSIGYRHGSEPPAYKYVRHRWEIGLVLKLAQVDKG